MSDERWKAVDDYYAGVLTAADPVMDDVLKASEVAGLPPIQVSPLQGRMLMLLAQMAGAKRILEIGTLGGYSTIWLARALPKDGEVVTLEAEPLHADTARANIERAGFSQTVEIKLGPAAQTLDAMVKDGVRPFDFIFIDADKPGYPAYLDLAIKLSWPGTVIVADNMVRGGAVADAESDDETVKAVRLFNEKLAADKRLSATAVQTVGAKGYDGFVLARMR
ncbi:MAG: O-methyltransferase [Proteobacteria bacterium]|nr:O-methyltransferase [Pseudomonadota bacterium]